MNNDCMDMRFWGDLAPWEVYRSDLVLTIHHTLTEPTCPTARISFEIPIRAGYDVIAEYHGNTVESAIQGAMSEAKEVLKIISTVSDATDKEYVLCAAKMGFWLERETFGYWRVGLGRKDLRGTRVPGELAEALVREGRLVPRKLKTKTIYVYE